MDRQEKFEVFRALHAREGAFVVANPWDAGSALILSAMGFEALATSSAGYGFTVGRASSAAAMTRAEVLENCARIVEATDLPVTADLEEGFGASPEACARTIREAAEVGLVGGSIEDATGDRDAPLFSLEASVERIAASVEAARGKSFVLTARAEGFLWGRDDLGEVIARLQAFAEAGADVLYAPGLPDLAAIRTLCAEVDKPVNVVMGLTHQDLTVAQLAEAGVKRVSVGGSFARAAWGGLKRAAEEVLGQGTFGYLQDAMPGAELGRLMSREKAARD